MKVIKWHRFLKNGLNAPVSGFKGKKSSMTVGVFDGVHLGHQALIRQVVSHNADYTPVVVTFRQNHKTKRIKNETDNNKKDILNYRQKLKKLKKSGIKITIVIDFTGEFKKMTGIEFIEILYKHGNIGFFTVGSNFHCGYELDTNAEKIKSFFSPRNIPVEIVPEVMEGSLPISSTRIRKAIAEGDLILARKMLGAR